MRIWILILAVACGTSAALGHEDIVPYQLSGQLVTGGHDDEEGTNHVVQRVFGYDFGEVLANTYVIGDPGFNNGSFAVGVFPGNGLLPVQRTLGFELLTNLSYWDGSDPVTFAAAPLNVALALENPVEGGSVLVSGSGITGDEPVIQSTGASGRVHRHLISRLNFTDGTNPDEPNAPDGIYLVGLKLLLPDSGLADSDPIYLVYNNGLDEDEHDLAMDWVQTNLVPEPASWAMMAVALVAVSGCGWRRMRGARD
jgi:hypothetical protein